MRAVREPADRLTPAPPVGGTEREEARRRRVRAMRTAVREPGEAPRA